MSTNDPADLSQQEMEILDLKERLQYQIRQTDSLKQDNQELRHQLHQLHDSFEQLHRQNKLTQAVQDFERRLAQIKQSVVQNESLQVAISAAEVVLASSSMLCVPSCATVVLVTVASFSLSFGLRRKLFERRRVRVELKEATSAFINTISLTQTQHRSIPVS